MMERWKKKEKNHIVICLKWKIALSLFECLLLLQCECGLQLPNHFIYCFCFVVWAALYKRSTQLWLRARVTYMLFLLFSNFNNNNAVYSIHRIHRIHIIIKFYNFFCLNFFEWISNLNLISLSEVSYNTHNSIQLVS